MRALASLVIAVGLLISGPAFADKNADAHYKEGLAYKLEGKVDKAIEALQAAVAQNPKHGMAWASLGHLYKQKQAEPAKIVGAYEAATAVIKKDKTLWSNLGMAYYRNKQVDKALEALETACKIYP